MVQRHTDSVEDQEVAPAVHFEVVKGRNGLIPAQLTIHLRLVRQKAGFLRLGSLMHRRALTVRKGSFPIPLTILWHLPLDCNFLAREDVESGAHRA